MFEGSILKDGIPEELAKDEMVRKVYLGQNFELRKKKLEFKFITLIYILTAHTFQNSDIPIYTKIISGIAAN